MSASDAAAPTASFSTGSSGSRATRGNPSRPRVSQKSRRCVSRSTMPVDLMEGGASSPPRRWTDDGADEAAPSSKKARLRLRELHPLRPGLAALHDRLDEHHALDAVVDRGKIQVGRRLLARDLGLDRAERLAVNIAEGL